MFAGCLHTWASKLQAETALSATEAEFIALSEGLCTAIPIMDFIGELRENGVGLPHGVAKVRCKVIEDNTRDRVIASVPRIQPRKKHINNKYWHILEHVEQGRVSIHPVKSEDQLADILTKPLPKQEYQKLRDIILGNATAPSASGLQGSVMIREKGNLVTAAPKGDVSKIEKQNNPKCAVPELERSENRAASRLISSLLRSIANQSSTMTDNTMTDNTIKDMPSTTYDMAIRNVKNTTTNILRGAN